MNTYCLVDTGKQMPRWCELVNNREGNLVWVDFKGRSVPFDDSKVVASVTGSNIHATINEVPERVVTLEQDFAYRYLLDPWSTQGWLAPDGKFWGCRFFAHDDIATALLRRSAAGLEHDGWIRVHEDSFQRADSFRDMTRNQSRTLEKLGFIETEAPGRRERNFSVDRTLPAPRYAIKVPDHVIEQIARLEAAASQVEAVPENHLESLISRLQEHPILAELLEHEHEVIPEVGPGTWDWMIKWDEVHIGSEEYPEDLLKAVGLRLHKTSFDTIELMSWHVPGLVCEIAEETMIRCQFKFSEQLGRYYGRASADDNTQPVR